MSETAAAPLKMLDEFRKSAKCATVVQKAGARAAANKWMAQGRIQREPCTACGAKKAEMHHPDYTRPLDVVWLCRTCHGRLHRGAEPPIDPMAKCKCGKPARMNQRNCFDCHKVIQQVYRVRRKLEQESLRKAKRELELKEELERAEKIATEANLIRERPAVVSEEESNVFRRIMLKHFPKGPPQPVLPMIALHAKQAERQKLRAERKALQLAEIAARCRAQAEKQRRKA